MFWIAENSRAKVAKNFKDKNGNTVLSVEHKDKYTLVRLSSSRRKGKNEEGYIYSNWSFVKFVGKAHEFALENMEEGTVIVLKQAGFQNESWEDADGKTHYPTRPTLVVFDAELYTDNRSTDDGEPSFLD